jgi:hypothetical protein
VTSAGKVLVTNPFSGTQVVTRSRCLPDTLTVTLGGFATAFPAVSRIPLAFSSCQGEGAAGYVNAPEPGSTPGPVDTPILTAGGGGYAAIGRVEPTITGDSNSTVTFTLAEEAGDCDWPYWRIASAAVVDGGDEGSYTDNQQFYLYYGPEVMEVSPAYLRVRTVRAAPTIVADLSGAIGTGGALSVNLSAGTDLDGRDIWGVDTLSIDTAGTGYVVDDPIAFVVTDGQESYSAFGRVTSVGGSGEITGYVIDSPGEYFKDTGVADIIVVDDGGVYYEEDPTEPALLADVTATVDGGGGTGATFTISIDDDPESPTFGSLTGIALDDGGDDYNGSDYVRSCCDTALDGRTFVLRKGARPCAREGQVDSNDNATDYYPVSEGWPLYPYLAHFCRETASVPMDDCQASRPACVYEHRFCTGNAAHATRGALQVVWRGPEKPAYVVLITESPVGSPTPLHSMTCDVLMTAETLVGVDDPIEFEASHPSGTTASVSEGGTYDENNQWAGPYSCLPCCQGDAAPPEEVTVSYTYPTGLIAHIQSYWSVDEPTAIEMAWTHYQAPPEGDHVLTLQEGGTSWNGDYLFVEVVPCATQNPGPPRATWGFREVLEFDSAGNGSIEDTHECNHCNKKCMTVFGGGGSYGLFYGENGCASRCQDSPMCGPAAGTYPHRISAYAFTGFGSMVIA